MIEVVGVHHKLFRAFNFFVGVIVMVSIETCGFVYLGKFGVKRWVDVIVIQLRWLMPPE